MFIANNLNGFRDLSLETKSNSLDLLSKQENGSSKITLSYFDKAFQSLHDLEFKTPKEMSQKDFTSSLLNTKENELSDSSKFYDKASSNQVDTKKEIPSKSIENQDNSEIQKEDPLKPKKIETTNKIHQEDVDKVKELKTKIEVIKKQLLNPKEEKVSLKQLGEEIAHMQELLHSLLDTHLKHNITPEAFHSLEQNINTLKNALKGMNPQNFLKGMGNKDSIKTLLNQIENKFSSLTENMKLMNKDDSLKIDIKTIVTQNQNTIVKKAPDHKNINSLESKNNTQNILSSMVHEKGFEKTPNLNHSQAQINNHVHHIGTKNITLQHLSQEGSGNKDQNFDGNAHFIKEMDLTQKSRSPLQAGSLSSTFANRLELGRNILNQIGDAMKGYIGKNQSHFTIQLNPEDLGKVKVVMDMKNQVISGHIVVENEQVKEMLKERFSEMKTMFQNSGVHLSDFNVQTQAEYDQGNRNHNQNAQAFFEAHKEATTQVKLGKELNFEKAPLEYEKVIDNLYDNGKFAITI